MTSGRGEHENVERTVVSGPAPFLGGRPETLFGVHDVVAGDEVATGSMSTAAWMVGPDGRPSVGGLALLIDDVFAYSVVAERPEGHWALSTEIMIDVCRPVPAPPARFRAKSRVVGTDATGGLSRAEVFDAAGRVVVAGTQRLRFVAGEPGGVTGAREVWPVPVVRGGTLAEVIGLEVSGTDTGARGLLPVDAQLINPVGTLHGGVLLAAVECVGLAALDVGRDRLRTSSVHVTYVRGAQPADVVDLEATLQYRGRSLGVVQIVARGSDGRPCVVAMLTGGPV